VAGASLLASGVSSASRSGLSLTLHLSEMKERTGTEFRLAAPMLLLNISNSSQNPTEALAVPQIGVDMIVSLRVALTRVGAAEERTELRHATLLRPWTVQLAPLSAGETLAQALSPLSVERRDVPLALGRYRVKVCVPPSGEATYPSQFTDRFGGVCSNEIEIEVKRRK